MEAANISLIVYDCDGVLTDNRVIVDETGKESAVFHRGDGFAISAIAGLSIRQLILSTEENPIVKARAAKLNIPVIYRAKNKRENMQHTRRNPYKTDYLHLKHTRLTIEKASQICYN